MRRLRYSVAMSLDGFLAGPNGEYDWIVMDPAFDFTAFFVQFDTLLMGRRTFELTEKTAGPSMPGMRVIVCSTTLQRNDSSITITRDAAATVTALKKEKGRDIWLFGGGALFRSLLDARLVDTIEVAVIPIALSQGVPLLPAGARSPRLELMECKAFPTGAVALSYTVRYAGRRPATKTLVAAKKRKRRKKIGPRRR
jgi:dihydrofolate reductase